MDKSEPTMGVRTALRAVGWTGVVLAMATVLWSSMLYGQDHEFSIFRTYLSDIGNTPKWPQVVFNSGMLIAAPLRYLFLILLVLQLRTIGAGQVFAISALIIGAVVVIGSAGLAAIPYSLDMSLHKKAAFLYFFGTVILQMVIAVREWRLGLPAVLPISSLAVVVIYLTFAVLMSSVGRIEGVTRDTPVIWEWLAFGSLMFWLISHSVVVGDGQAKRNFRLTV